MLFKTKKMKTYESIYMDILSEYFSYMRSTDLNLTAIGVSEFLRYSLCIALDLPTVSSNKFVEENSFTLVQKFKYILNKYDIYNESISYRQGLLEACVHCIEMSRERVMA